MINLLVLKETINGEKRVALVPSEIKKLDGSDLPNKNLNASLLIIQSKNNDRYFIVYKNFKRILRWNTSNFFAIAVGKLSDGISVN